MPSGPDLTLVPTPRFTVVLMTAATATLTVGKLAEEVGVSTDAIRHWEREHARPATPIVAVTASAMQHERDACLAAGMDDVIVKPFSAQALADALARYCAVRQHGAFVFGAVS